MSGFMNHMVDQTQVYWEKNQILEETKIYI